MQERFEGAAFGKQKELESRALELWNKDDITGARKLLTNYSDQNSAVVLKEWWKLSEFLYVKYNDGYVNTNKEIAHPFSTRLVAETGRFEDGPTSYHPKRSDSLYHLRKRKQGNRKTPIAPCFSY